MIKFTISDRGYLILMLKFLLIITAGIAVVIYDIVVVSITTIVIS